MHSTKDRIHWTERPNTLRLRRIDTELATLDLLAHEAMARRRATDPDTEDYRQVDERIYALTALAGELRLHRADGGRCRP